MPETPPPATVYSAFAGTANDIFCREQDTRSMAALQNEQAILQLLEDSYSLSYSLPLLLNSQAGLPYVQYDGALWTARRRIAGYRFDWRVPDWSTEHSHLSGQALAQLHSVSYVPGVRDLLEGTVATSSAEQKSGLATGELDYISHIRQQIDKLQSIAEKWLRGDVREVFKRLTALLGTAQFEQIQSSTRCLIHGDFHPGNVIYQMPELEIQVKAVIDWDYSRWGSQLIDFSVARMMFAGTFRQQLGLAETSEVAPVNPAPGQPEPLPESLSESHSRAFVLGYKRTLARVLKDKILYPEGIVSWEEQSLSHNQQALARVDEASVKPYHLVAMLLILLFELDQIEQNNDKDQRTLANAQNLLNQLSRVCATF